MKYNIWDVRRQRWILSKLNLYPEDTARRYLAFIRKHKSKFQGQQRFYLCKIK